MLNFTHHQEDASQNHSEIHFTSMKMSVITRQIITRVRKNVGKLVPSDTADGSVTWCSDFGKQHSISWKG